MEKYLPIEAKMMGREILLIPLNLHDRIHQAALKERAWWVTEELAECMDATLEGKDDKALEEMSDALHFLTELLILSGVSADNFNSTTSPELKRAFDSGPPPGACGILGIIVELGMAMWQLRNKSWKTTQVFTDVLNYQLKLYRTYRAFLDFLQTTWKLSLEDICVLYLRKSVVNQFRIRSGY